MKQFVAESLKIIYEHQDYKINTKYCKILWRNKNDFQIGLELRVTTQQVIEGVSGQASRKALARIFQRPLVAQPFSGVLNVMHDYFARHGLS